MFILEYRQLYIVPEPLTKNRTCQSYRWKQYAMCESREPLKKIMASQKRPSDWRITEMPWTRKADGTAAAGASPAAQ